MQLNFVIFILTFFFTQQIRGEITPPNYNFNLALIEFTFPGKSLEELKKKIPLIEIIEDNGDQKFLLCKFKQKDYTLDIYTQVKKNQIVDTYIRLPQYFHHDILLKDLKDKWKKQDKFVNKDRSSYYVWFNRDSMNILYQGSCSITCFPMFIEFTLSDKSATPLYEKLNDSLPLWQ